MSEAGPAAMPAMAELVGVMDRLRSPGGCPWDAEQSHASLVRYAIEEAFEVADAVEHGDREDLREELGDLLLQVVFHARIAQEHPAEPFDLEDVAATITAKLRRRHPHVFGAAQVQDAAEVNRRWEEIKRAEKSRSSALDGIPVGLPALVRAQKVLSRAHRAGLDADPGTPAPREDPAAGAATPAAIGQGLLALVARAHEAGVDAEGALRDTVRQLESRARAQEAATGLPDSTHG